MVIVKSWRSHELRVSNLKMASAMEQKMTHLRPLFRRLGRGTGRACTEVCRYTRPVCCPQPSLPLVVY